MRSSAWLTIAIVGCGVAFGLVGCGDDDDDGPGGGGGGSKAGSSTGGTSTAGKGGKGGGGTGNNTAGKDNEGGTGVTPMGGETSSGGTAGGDGGVPGVDGGSTSDGGTSVGGADGAGGDGDVGGVGGAGGQTAASTDVELHDNVFTTADGLSLYLRDTDTASTTDPVSSCSGGCLTNWPLFSVENPTLPAELSADDFRVFTRGDSSKQATYKGWPLYRYVGDTMPGDTNGKNLPTWHLVKLPFVAP